MPLRVLHLTGSPVDPVMGELSRLYAGGCLAAIDEPDRYEAVIAHVDVGGAWRLPRSLADLDAAAPLAPAEALAAMGELDVVVPQMFCLPGMTAYRDLFTVLGVPLVGNTGTMMALAADKATARAVVSAAGVPVPAGRVVREGERPDVALPVVVKPVDADNSSGLSLVRSAGELPTALRSAWQASSSRAALVETFVEAGREVRCGVIERAGELRCLPLEEYRLDPDQPVRSVEQKLGRPNGSTLALMAKTADVAWIVDPADPITSRVWEVARTCHRALGCRDHSLFDLRIDPEGNPWFLEASPYCSFSPKSVVVTMAAAAGITLPELFASQVQAALARAVR